MYPIPDQRIIVLSNANVTSDLLIYNEYQKPDYYIREMTSRELGNMVYYIDCYNCCAQKHNQI